MTQSRPWTRCIVLTKDGLPSDAMVTRLAAARDWITVEQHDPYLALAEVCIRQRAQQSRRSWGLASAEQLAIVIVDLERWEALDEFLKALEHYVQGVSIWSFRDDQLHSISPGQFQSIAQPQPKIETMPMRPLRMAGTESVAKAQPPIQHDSAPGDPESEEESGRITPLEIEMLLAASTGDEDES